MTQLSTTNMFQCFAPLGDETLKHNLNQRNNPGNRNETTSLKDLASKVLSRNTARNKNETDKKEAVSVLVRTETRIVTCELEERIAFVQNESGLPYNWAEAFARMDCMQRPGRLSQATWNKIVNNMGLLLDKHAKALIENEWTIADVFGVHKASPEKRYDGMGLLIALADSLIVKVEKDRIMLSTPTGREQSYYKTSSNNPAEQIYIWEL